MNVVVVSIETLSYHDDMMPNRNIYIVGETVWVLLESVNPEGIERCLWDFYFIVYVWTAFSLTKIARGDWERYGARE